MLHLLLAHGAISPCRKIEVVGPQRCRIGEPPLFAPLRFRIALVPRLQPLVAVAIGGDEAGQVVRHDCLIVVGVDLVAVVVGVQEHDVLGLAALLEEKHRGLNA